MTVHILGRGGHARVCADAIKSRYPNVRYIGKDEHVPEKDNYLNWVELVIGIGDIKTRRRLWKEYEGRNFIQVIHPSAVMPDYLVGDGLQVMAGAIIQCNAVFADNILVNTRASIDHDCIIGSHCHIAPGATLCGGVNLGHSCFIGAGATIVEGVHLDPETFIPAGSLVVKQDDIRRPIRLVRSERPDEVTMVPLKGNYTIPGGGSGSSSGKRDHPDPQPSGPADPSLSAQRSKADPQEP